MLPAGWEKTTLGEVSADRVDQGGPTGERFSYIDIGSIDNARKRIESPADLPAKDAPSRARQRALASDVLVSMTRPNLNAVAIVPRELDGAIASTGFHVLRAQGVAPRFIYYAVQTNEFVEAMTAVVQGALYPAVRPADVRRFELGMPPPAEQDRIVAAIEQQLSRVDAGAAALERVQKELARYRASVLKAACEGRLVPTEASLARAEGRSYEPASELLARILAERRTRWEASNPKRAKKYTEPAPPDDSALPKVPEGWVWAAMDQLIAAGPTNGLYLPKSRYGDGTPILRIDDFQTWESRSNSELRRVRASGNEATPYLLGCGDVVINRVNSPSHLGKAIVIEARHMPAVFESNMMRLTLAIGAIPAFAHIYLASIAGRRRLTANAKWAVNQASINQRDVAATAFPLPPLAEQHRIVAEVERRLSIADEVAASVASALARAARLRQSILKRAFEGKLVPQDPNDEPASALLARIRAEREAAATNTKRRVKGAAR